MASPPSRSTPAPGEEKSSTNRSSVGPWLVAGIVLLLLILHQDNWFWTDETLVFGFMPVGLFWHACLSIAASVTWFLATKIAWPIDEETVARLAESPPADAIASPHDSQPEVS